jgi:hypothetical protein
MSWRGLLALIVCVIVAPAVAAQAGTTRFRQADYETYFVPGRFETWAPDYNSRGELEVIKTSVTEEKGARVLVQTYRTLDVGPNYDRRSRYPYYKIQSEAADRMVWDAKLAAYRFRFTNEDFFGDRSLVWESRNSIPTITSSDVPRGNLQAFYRAADERAGEDASALREFHREDKVGSWTKACGFLKGQPYEVACAFTHEPTGRVEMYYYRREGLVS